ncbi:MAG TPA: calcium-binding protein, partial [bacterium]|nr:calcium-binding protein [bacterium]
MPSPIPRSPSLKQRSRSWVRFLKPWNRPFSGRSRSRPPRKVWLEPLEPRMLLSGDGWPLPVITALADAAEVLEIQLEDISNDVTFQIDGDAVIVFNNMKPDDTGTSYDLEGQTQVHITGTEDDDIIHLDIVNSPAGLSILLDAGGGEDRLVLAGGTFDSAAYEADGADSGSIDLDGLLIKYTGLEPITDNTNAVDRIFTVNIAGDQIIQLGDDGDATNGQSIIQGGEGTLFESITFNHPTGSLTIHAGDGDDEIRIGPLEDSFGASIQVNGGDGADRLTIDADGGTPVFGTGQVTVNGVDILYQTDTEDIEIHNVSLNAPDRQAILDSLRDLATAAGIEKLGKAGDLAQELPLTDNTLGELIDAGAVLQKLHDDVEDFFEDPANATTKQFIDFLKSWNVTLTGDDLSQVELGDIVVTVDPDAIGVSILTTSETGAPKELAIRVKFSTNRVSPYDFAPPLDSSSGDGRDPSALVGLADVDELVERGIIVLSDSGSVTTFDLETGFDFDAIFGNEYGVADTNFAVLDAGGFVARAGFDNTADTGGQIDAEVRIGFLGAGITGGTVVYSAVAPIQMTDRDGDGRLSAVELSNLATQTDPVAAVDGTGTLSVTLPVTVRAGFQSGSEPDPRGESLTIHELGGDFFASGVITSIPEELNDFTTLEAPNVLSSIVEIGEWLTKISQSDYFQAVVPFLKDIDLRDAIDFGRLFNDTLTDAIQYTPDPSQPKELAPRFDTAQELAAKLEEGLAAVMDNPVVEAVYDSATHRLSYRLTFGGEFDELFPVLTAANDISALQGRLSGDATFNVILNGVDSRAVTLPASSTSDNTTLADLVDDVHRALFEAGLAFDPDSGSTGDGTGKLVAELDNGRLILRAIDPSIKTLRVTASNGSNTAVTELGLATDQSTTSKIARASFTLESGALQDLRTFSTFDVSAEGNIDMTLGFDLVPNLTPTLGSGLYDESVYAGEDYDTAESIIPDTGELSGDAVFTLIIDEQSYVILVSANDTAGNDAEPTGKNARLESAERPLVFFNEGRLVQDATFQLSVTNKNTSSPATDVITLRSDDTDDNESMEDLKSDLEAVLADSGLSGLVLVGIEDGRLVLEAAHPDIEEIQLTAVEQLTLPEAAITKSNGNPTGADFQILRPDETPVAISVTGAGWDALKDAINTQIGMNPSLNGLSAKLETAHGSTYIVVEGALDFTVKAGSLEVEAQNPVFREMGFTQNQTGSLYRDPGDALALDVQEAIEAALGASRIECVHIGGRILLHAKSESGITFLKFGETNAVAENELGFRAGESSRAVSTKFYLQDVVLAAGLEFTADDIDAVGRYGFLGIETEDGEGEVTAEVTFTLDGLLYKSNPDSLLHETNLPAGDLDILLDQFLGNELDKDAVLGELDPGALDAGRVDVNRLRFAPDSSHEGLYVDAAALDHLLESVGLTRQSFESHVGGDVDPAWGLYELLDRLNDQQANGQLLSLSEFLNCIRIPFEDFLDGIGADLSDYLAHFNTEGLNFKGFMEALGLTTPAGFFKAVDLTKLGLLEFIADQGLDRLALADIDLLGLGEVMDSTDQPLGAQLFKILQQSGGIHSEISSSASVALNRVTAVDGFVALQSTGGSSPETGLTLRMEYDHWIRDPLGATSVPDAVTLSPAGNTTAGDYAVLTQFENASFGAVLEGLKAAADYLEELGQDASLDAHLPLLNAGVNDLFHYTDRFRSAVQNLASHPAATVQALEAALKEAFGLPADSPKIGVVLDTDSVNGNALRVDLEYFTESVDALRLNLDVPTLLDLADPDPILEENLENIQILQASNSAGNLTVSLQATYELMLGIGLTGPQAQNPFLYRSGNNNQKTQFRIDARAQASNMDFTLQTGPLGLIVVDGEAELDGSFQFELTGGPERHGLDSLETLVEHTESRVTGGASATLPLFYPTEHNPLDAIIGPDGTIVPEGNHLLIVEIEDLEPFLEGAYGAGNVNLKSPDIRTRFDELDLRNYLLDPDGLISSLDALLETLQDALNTQVYSRGLPLIGDNLTGPGQILESFREDLLTGIYLSILGATPDQAIERVQEALFAVLGTDHGLLVDSDGNPAPDKDAIQVTEITNESGTLLNVEFGLHLQGTVEVVVPEGFDTVLPALGLTLDADMQVTLEWEFDFLFGVDLFDGFYLDTSSEEELRIAFHVVFADDHSLANPAEGFLNYLQVEAVDGYLSPNYNEDPQDPAANFKPADETPTHLTGRYEINFLDPDGEVSGGGPDDGDRMTFDEFTSPATLPEDLVSATVSGRADINLFIHVGFGENANFPSLYADFELDWTFDAVEIKPPVNQFGTTIGSQLEYLNYGDSDDFRVSYLNVKLDLGEFITQYVAPILGFVEDVFDPMAWLIDPQKGFLFKKDPIMSFLTGKRYTMLDSISTFYSGAKNMKPFLEAISYVYGLSKMMGQFEAGLGNAYLRLGSLQMPDVRGMLDLPNIIGATPEAEALPEAGSVNLPQLSVFGGLTLEGGTYDNPEFQVTNATFYPTTEWNTQIQGAYDQINANEAARKDGGIGPVTTKDPTGLKKSVSGGASAGMDFLLDFPLLTNPLEALKLLTGEHPTLFLLDLPTFSFDVNISVEFVFWVPPKVAAGVYGGLGADIKVGFGYDTLGLEKFSRSGDKGDIWDGFFINDIDYFTGRDRPELTLRGFVNIEANVDAGFVKVGGGGGITGTVYFNLNDPDHDGKVRINEMEANWKQGFDFLFDISGLIKWNLYLYVDVMGIRAATFDIVSGVIYTFDLSANRPPVLAADIEDGVLRLNMGEYAAERIHGNVTDGDEIFKVSATATDAAAGTQTIRVEYNGNVQSYSHVKKVVADGGEGNDQIIVDASVILPTILYGGNGDDILYGGSGVDEIYGGAGADKLWGRKGDDFLDGGTGPDELHGEEGADTLYGGFGDDHLFGGDGDDVLRGMFGNDIMAGEAGDDMYVFENGWGNDTVLEDENPGVPVTGVSEGEGGRIRITADGHGLNTGDRVVLRGITGTGGNGSLDGANGIFTITKVDENSFDLDGTVFHGGDVVYEGNGKLYSPLNDSTDTWDFSLVRTGLVITLDDGRTVAQDQLNGHTVTHEGFGIEYFLGGRGRDIFNIHESSLVNRTTFDGQRGSDDFLVFLGPNLGRLTTMDSGP